MMSKNSFRKNPQGKETRLELVSKLKNDLKSFNGKSLNKQLEIEQKLINNIKKLQQLN